MVAEVSSIYLKRQDGSLELFATEGLNPGAVHNTLLKRGRGPRRALRRARRAHQRARRAEPPGLLLPARDGRGDLPLLPGGADPARRRGAGRPHHPEQDAEGILRRGRGGAADDRHGARRAPRDRGGRRGQHRRPVQPRRRPRRARPAPLGRAGAGPRRRCTTRAWSSPRSRRRTPMRSSAGSRPPSPSCRPPSTRCSSRATSAPPASIATCSRPTACSPTTAAGSGA